MSLKLELKINSKPEISADMVKALRGIDDNLSITNRLIQEASRDIAKKRNDQMEAEAKKRLSVLGFEFIDQKDFYEFCSKRLTRIIFDDIPDQKGIYLDYKSKKQPGTLILWYSDKIEITYGPEAGRVNFQIGNISNQ